MGYERGSGLSLARVTCRLHHQVGGHLSITCKVYTSHTLSVVTVWGSQGIQSTWPSVHVWCTHHTFSMPPKTRSKIAEEETPASKTAGKHRGRPYAWQDRTLNRHVGARNAPRRLITHPRHRPRLSAALGWSQTGSPRPLLNRVNPASE